MMYRILYTLEMNQLGFKALTDIACETRFVQVKGYIIVEPYYWCISINNRLEWDSDVEMCSVRKTV